MQAEGLIGSPMTYSLFEVAKEKAEEMIVDVCDDVTESAVPVSILVQQMKLLCLLYLKGTYQRGG